MRWNAPISGYPVVESITTNRDKGVRKTHQFRSALVPSESCRQSLQKGLLRTMLDRAPRLSSSWTHFSDEFDRLKTVFSRLKYPKHLVNPTIKSFVHSKVCDQQRPLSPLQETDDTIRVVLPFKDQIPADIVKKQLKV